MKEIRIEINHRVLAGKPVIKGTRIPVTLILNLLENGYTFERILMVYPHLTKKDISAALDYVKQRIERETVKTFPRRIEFVSR